MNSHFGGYNGGAGVDGLWFSYAGSGGATHIATRSGLLKDLESYKGTLVNNSYYNSSVIMIVAGGGGLYTAHSATYSDKNCPTADMGSSNGGGYKGGGRNSLGGTQINGGVSQITDPTTGTVYTEDCNGKFGQGCGVHVYNQSSSAGGGGFYGGAGFNNLFECGGGGSGYIASSSLISGGGITKHMTGYSIPTSTAAATRTNSNTNVSATATADYSKMGNGYAKITYLGVSV